MSDKETESTQLWKQFQSRSTATVVLETAVFSLVMVLSLVGNLMVCYVVRRSPRLRRPSNHYIISLALTDIIQALFTMPLSIGLLATGQKLPFGSSACFVSAISKLSVAQISVITMTLMALNRYYKIVKPSRYPAIFTKKFIIVTASLAWLLPIFTSLFSALALGFQVKPNPGFVLCIVELSPLMFPAVSAVTYTPYFIIGFCYYKIYRAVEMHNANVSWQSSNVEDVNICKPLFATVVAFAGLLSPCHIIFGCSLLLGFYYFPRQLTLFVTLLVYVSSCVNPFIYGFMNRVFQNEFKTYIRRKRTAPQVRNLQ